MKNKILTYIASLYVIIAIVVLSLLSINQQTETLLLIGIWVFFLFSMAFLLLGLRLHKRYEKLTFERKTLSVLVNSMSDFIVFKDDEGRWLSVNDFGLKLYNLEPEAVIGKTDLELAKAYPQFEKYFRYCYETDELTWSRHKPTRVEETLIVKDEERLFDVLKVPLDHEDGSRKGLFAIGRDITELRQAEESLIKNEKLSVVGQLAAGIAHEIRNPLTSLKGFVDLCRKEDGDIDNYLSIMHTELERINKIVDELLLIAKPTKIPFQQHYLHEIVDSVIELMEPEAKEAGITIVLKYDETTPAVRCEECQIKQVLINIIKNAIEASEEKTTITVTIKTKDNTVLLAIKDEGCGIPKQRLDKLGEPFFTMKEKGTGLGMTVTFKIIEAHNGTIDIDSEVNIGTTVNVRLPLIQHDNEKKLVHT
ncbi:ATP-binding protein [Alkalihalobacillus sp. LMS39]|uniref:ATP-binding protein n=1 Tax=Alkalihalobacillus sp. LMS39 TaxID=2924032 RepID=UPI001FB24F3B|nr:ATP-binding protein [Alkalihalobacillus sp. LMS39]UOE92668.1 ATP-binding protein [Alkalihalobacillus sp. LMS39]